MKTRTSAPPRQSVAGASSWSVPTPDVVARARRLATAQADVSQGKESTRGPSLAALLAHAEGCAGILTDIDADPGAIAAAWLFGFAAALPLARIEREFGADIARIVDGMRRLRRLREIHGGHDSARESRAAAARLETLRRMLLALSVDARVVLLRLASRLQTLRRHAQAHTVPEESVSRETLEVLAPLANRLGLWTLKWQLEDLAFRFLEPERYHELARAVALKRRDREQFVANAIVTLSDALSKAGIQAQVLGRPKHLYSLWVKMQGKALSAAHVRDLHALRVIVADVRTCYQALDTVHAMWPPMAGEFDDYISAPKSNGYQSLQTVVVSTDAMPIEVQIRTEAMHAAAEYGDASHWRYKEGLPAASKDAFARRIGWLRQLLDWQRDIGQSIGAATVDGQADPTVYAMTPQGKVIALPPGSTPIDFAYAVHTDLGHRCRGARVDGVQVPLTRRLMTGETVEIVQARGQQQAAAGPSRDWLNPELGYLASQRARAKVRHWFNLLEVPSAPPPAGTDRAAVSAVERSGTASTRTLAAATPTVAARPDATGRAVTHVPRGHKPARASPAGSGVLIEGVGALLTQLARCCRPLPPDQIAGYVTRGSGVTVHRQSCSVWEQLRARSPERIVAASWPMAANTMRSASAPATRDKAAMAGRSGGSGFAAVMRFPVDLEIEGRSGEGLLSEVAEVLAREKIALVAASRSDRGEAGLLRITVELDGAQVLPALLTRLSRVPGVSRATRR